MDQTRYPHVACFSCGKRIGAYDALIQKLTNRSLPYDQALAAVGLSQYLPRINRYLDQGLSLIQAMRQLNLDYERIRPYIEAGPTLKEAMTVLHLEPYYEQVLALTDRGLTDEQAFEQLGLDYLPVKQLVEGGLSIAQAMDVLGIDRICCRTNILSPAVIPLGAGTIIKEEQPIARVAAPIQAVSQIPQPRTNSPLVTIQPRQTGPSLPPRLGRRLY